VKSYDFAPAAAVGMLAIALIPWLYWPALHATYRLDDYAWLSLANTLAHGRSLLWALFSAAGAGSIRPLGERLWFLLASILFGLNPAPLHALAWCVQALNVALVIDIGRRLLGSPLAAAIAAALINNTLVEPMVWASAFNEVLFACFFSFGLRRVSAVGQFGEAGLATHTRGGLDSWRWELSNWRSPSRRLQQVICFSFSRASGRLSYRRSASFSPMSWRIFSPCGFLAPGRTL